MIPIHISFCQETLHTHEFKTVNKRQVIMESAHLQEWRHNYLMQIKEFRKSNWTILYLDETWYNTHNTASIG
jgi:hypothetical protein